MAVWLVKSYGRLGPVGRSDVVGLEWLVPGSSSVIIDEKVPLQKLATQSHPG